MLVQVVTNFCCFFLQSVTPTFSVLGPAYLTTELQFLLEEVVRLREETSSIECNCSNPNCPFNASADEKESESDEDLKDSPDLGFGSMDIQDLNCKKSHPKKVRYSLQHSLNLAPLPLTHRKQLSNHSTSLTNISRGVQKRADGTILEHDYRPGLHGKRKHGLFSGFSLSHLNRLKVCFNEALEADCQVDQDGLTSNHDYMFSREAPERRIKRSRKRDQSSQAPRKFSEGPLSIYRHSSADVISRHSSVPSIESSTVDRLANFSRLQSCPDAKGHSIACP